jgi:dipeptidyl aminopeptidase/acylaminoacyl peptidase
MAARRKALSAEDLYRFRLITDSRISPDGRHVVYSLERIERKSEKKFSDLWVVPTSGGRPGRFTYGNHVDRDARWSPDGRSIAFLSNRSDEKQYQVCVISFGGGEARLVTDLRGSFGTFEWSPDGRSIVFSFRKKDRDAVERERDKQKEKLGIVARHIDRVLYKIDGSGFFPKEHWHIWTVDVRTGRARQITKGDRYDENDPAWSPDGRSVVFMSNRSKHPDLNPENIDIFIVPASGGRPRKVETPIGMKFSVGFSPDGSRIAYRGYKGQGQWWRNISLWVVPAEGKGQARNLTARFDIEAFGGTTNDLTVEPPPAPPVWSPDGTMIYFNAARYGNGPLYSVPAQGRGDLEPVVSDPGAVLQFSIDKTGHRIAYLFGDMTNPVDLFIRDCRKEETRRLTGINRRILRQVDLGKTEEVWFTGPDRTPVQGWILKPPGFNARKQYPAILEIHGGPMLQYGNLFMHEFYYLAAQGYVVFFCNPRGSQGYGEKHSKAIWGNWGKADYADIMAWTDLVARKPYIDRKRIGVTGGSYGGFMINWIIGHTTRFKAAVTQRSIVNMISKYGTGDYNWLLEYRFGGKPPWEAIRRYWHQSPLAYFRKVKTPTLVIHSEEDHRCPIEQGEQAFVALKRLGVDTEMIRFPEEPHGLSRTGRTDRRIARLKHILRWFDRYLKTEERRKQGSSLRLK